MERGVIITPNYSVLNNGHGLQMNGSVEPTNLRNYLLFWDKIDYPTNNMIHIGGGQDIDFLIEEGFAKSTPVQFRELRGDQNGYLPLATQMVAYEENNKNEDEEWAIAQPTNNLIVPAEYAKKQGCLEFELYNAIQIPTGDIPLNEVIEFKNKRLPELLALRDAMDLIVDDIVSNQDIPKRKNKAISKLHRDLNDFNRVMKETGFKRVKRSLTTIVTDPCLATVSLANGFLPENYQPYTQGLNVAALGYCALKFGVKELNVGKSTPSEYSHFAYLSSIKNELV
ncbi:DUF6236 family protein [Vibrio lentus]|uniref:DUF6236 family protein n=1 Tax=Vibrio lentus TaxID=136468 RepID=UPI000C85C60B|nr:DUF6236 family protein [Vibrio lentus]PMG69107.1 hypothetical protein BCU86_09550 [Vibrio lentus]